MKLQDENVCVKCRATCCYFGGPTVTKQEKANILKAGFKNYFIPCHDGKGKILPYKNYFDLKIKNGKCPYLKNCSCSIYKVRPKSCKVWPVFAIIENGKLEYCMFSCPLAPHIDRKGVIKLKKLAESLPKRFYEITWGSMTPPEIKKCIKFKPVPLGKWIKRMK